jgi:cytochrome c oxidase subunit 2
LFLSPLDLPSSALLWESVYQYYSIFAWISGGVTFGLMIYLVVRYRSRAGAVPPAEKQRENRETWRGPLITVALMTVVLVLVGSQTLAAFPVSQTVPNARTSPFGKCDFSLGPVGLVFREVPNNGTNLNVCVTGQQFFWSFTYPNNHTGNELVVPVGRVVVLNVSSVDVYHQFGIPDFRAKTDAIPGRHNVIWIQPTTVGNMTIACFELCGVGHATMRTTLVVLSPASFQKWYASQGGVGGA